MSKMNSNNAALPWKFWPQAGGQPAVVTGTDDHRRDFAAGVCTIYEDDRRQGLNADDIGEFIVRAANSHDALVEALKSARGLVVEYQRTVGYSLEAYIGQFDQALAAAGVKVGAE